MMEAADWGGTDALTRTSDFWTPGLDPDGPGRGVDPLSPDIGVGAPGPKLEVAVPTQSLIDSGFAHWLVPENPSTTSAAATEAEVEAVIDKFAPFLDIKRRAVEGDEHARPNLGAIHAAMLGAGDTPLGGDALGAYLHSTGPHGSGGEPGHGYRGLAENDGIRRAEAHMSEDEAKWEAAIDAVITASTSEAVHAAMDYLDSMSHTDGDHDEAGSGSQTGSPESEVESETRAATTDELVEAALDLAAFSGGLSSSAVAGLDVADALDDVLDGGLDSDVSGSDGGDGDSSGGGDDDNGGGEDG